MEGLMPHIAFRALKFVVIGVAVAAAVSVVLSAAVPTGWYIAGSRPKEYEAGVDASAVYRDHASAYLKSNTSSVEGFGTLMQDFSADKYVGRRIRFSANVKSEAVQSWAGLWMRVDKQSTLVAFDNMQDRPITGTEDWQNYSVVLNVPQDATGVFFGVLLTGQGIVWLNSVKIEVVGSDVPTTGRAASGVTKRGDEPRNLDFKLQ
jgi:hypothetical protein